MGAILENAYHTYYAQGIILGPRDTVVNKIEKSLFS